MVIALAYLCKKIGNPITILMPKTMSKERIEILENLGAEVVLTEDFLGAILSKKNIIVTVLPDDDKKYLSTDLYNESITSSLVDNIKFVSVN